MAKEKKFTPVIALLIETDRDRGYGDHAGYFHITCRPVCIGPRYEYEVGKTYCKPDDIRGFGTGEVVNGLALDGLEVRCQGGNGDAERRLYGFKIEYRNVYSFDLYKVQKFAKTLATIDRRMTALTQKFGHVTTFAQYVARVADAIGATQFVQRNDAERKAFSGQTWRFMDVAMGIYAVDRLDHQWVKELEIKAEKERLAALATETETEAAS